MNQTYKYAKLTPHTDNWVKKIVQEPAALLESIHKYESPVNILHVPSFVENIKNYETVFNKYELKHQIFFARKANKAIAFVHAAREMGIGVDTASYRELQQTIKAGLSNDQIILTAAVKNRKLIELAIHNNIPIVIDNVDECKLIHDLCSEFKLRAHIIVRISGFIFVSSKLKSRFGFDIDFASTLIAETLPKEYPFFNYLGIHFHLNGYSIPQRAEALLQCIVLVDKLKKQHIETQIIDIGGGFLVNYLQSKSEWNQFFTELKASVLHQRSPVTYDRDPLGMIILDGRIYGEPTVYPYYNECNKGQFLDEILQYKNTDGTPIHQLIKSANVELRIEPGRSALDQAGITVAKIAFRKLDNNGDLLVGLEMNRTQLRSSSADFLLDPIHISIDEYSEEDCYGYLVGAYCLEQEFILKRKIQFKSFPKVGDMILFVNTAGYMMHFYESEAHLFELAKNLVFDETKSLIEIEQATNL